MGRWDKPRGRWFVFRELFSGDWCVVQWKRRVQPVFFREWSDAVRYANLRAGLDMLRDRLRGEMEHAWDTTNIDAYVAYLWAYRRVNKLLEGATP
ncbi:hypothetical protein [Corynebacterium lujinxingii]|uniref:Uncharacterized protein n=1 Tax=Corynebacterium lujinxingii TaxID=2763010 RepID=A0A7H0JWP7_9CORY|nr:hypothetical protein [Corynebacterium lujinxingii]MBC3178123.1 hypothetical protein [Corynebacterium lujinxingii]NNO09637.1 hypothetical protein [Corynebacterium lujinxingii]QNP89463.1 hypothetical protein IAU68_07055 [Corynebacterium lujinxingii]